MGHREMVAVGGRRIIVVPRDDSWSVIEPSAEVDLLLVDRSGNESWVEMGGCGMVDPNVFDAVGIDSEKYTGWAFGFGIERLTMRKYEITDIRWLYENDLRFLSQF